MKALKIIGLCALIIIAILAVGAAGYSLNQHNQTTATANTTSSTTTNTAKTKTAALAIITPAKTATAATCNADDLSLSTAAADGGGAGTTNFSLILTNTSARTCTLGGFPGVSLVNDNGNQIGSPAVRATNYTEKTITLTAKQQVKTIISVEEKGNFSDGTCKDGATKLRVYPPNDTGYLSIASTVTTWCPGFNVSPVLTV